MRKNRRSLASAVLSIAEDGRLCYDEKKQEGGTAMENVGYVSEVIFREMPPASSYLCALPVVRHLAKEGRLPFRAPVTFLVGENGAGKSTLLEAIAVAAGFNAEGGTRNFQFSTNNTHSELHRCIGLSRRAYPRDGFFLRAESFYNLATNVDELDRIDGGMLQSYGGVSLHAQSHGESFLSLMLNRFGGNGLYILDEPESALSPTRLMSLLTLIDELVKRNSQFIISTHSPILMAYPKAEILELGADGIRAVPYKETEHYRVTLEFLQNPERMLRYLMEE